MKMQKGGSEKYFIGLNIFIVLGFILFVIFMVRNASSGSHYSGHRVA